MKYISQSPLQLVNINTCYLFILFLFQLEVLRKICGKIAQFIKSRHVAGSKNVYTFKLELLSFYHNKKKICGK